MSRWVEVCRTEDIPYLEGRRVVVDGFHIAVFKSGEGFYAVGDVCPHLGGPLSDGEVASRIVSCPLHMRKFDLATGEAQNDDLPKLPTFPVSVDDGVISLDVECLSSRLKLSKACTAHADIADIERDEEEVA